MKKIMFVSITILVVVSMLIGGCARAPTPTKAPVPAATNPPAPTAPPTTPPPVTIKVFSSQTSSMDLATSTFSKYIEKTYNIKFNWTVTTSDCGDVQQKLQLSLASGDYPDLYLLIEYCDPFSTTDLLRYGKQGVFIPLNDLIDKYAPNIKAAEAKHPELKQMMTAPDGNIYGLPHLNGCYHCQYIQKMWVNTTWLKKLNIPMPKTTDEFKAMLEAFKTKDPNGNGKNDEIPMTAGIGQGDPITVLMNAFIYDDFKTYTIVNNGKVDIAANKPEWKDGLTYIHSLYAEGLIDPGAFTQNWEAVQKIGNADPEIMGVGLLFPWYLSAKAQNDYWAVGPLVGPKGAQLADYTNPSISGGFFVLTNKASKDAQVAAIKMIDYLYTLDGLLNGLYGVENVDWRKPKSGEIALNKDLTPLYATIPLPANAKPDNNSWDKLANYYWPLEWFEAWVSAPDVMTPEGFERKLQEATNLYVGKQPKEVFPYWAVWVQPEQADEAALLTKNITDYIYQNSVQFVTGTKSLDKDWDAYVTGLDKLGLNRYLQILQGEYDVYLKNK